ncbi:MAG TPA: hypothetical protein VMM12_01405 [Longimicrobiales bacterium]|nr:hypothetical protein [Longimicrobiales bacterium]
MARTRSRWCDGGRARVSGLAAAMVALCLAPAPARSQDDDADAACRALFSPSAVSECRLAVGAARVIQPRLAAALFAGNAVPGTASTLGMRLGTLPRMTLVVQVNAAPSELPPILDRSDARGERALLWGFTADAAVGLLAGFSPMPTVGGVLSLDLIGRAGYVPLPGKEGFHDGGAWGWSLGARLGALRESFTLPGIALTGSYGRIARTAFGDPSAATTDAFFEGAMSDLRVDLAATKRLGLVGVTGGVVYDRYASDLTAGFRESFGGPQLRVDGTAVHTRWSGYVNAAWTLLIFHASAEAGWQEAPVPSGIPSTVEVDPVGWFGGISFRISI